MHVRATPYRQTENEWFFENTTEQYLCECNGIFLSKKKAKQTKTAVDRTIRIFTWCARRSGASFHYGWPRLVTASRAGWLVGAVPDTLQNPVP